ncbi:alpha/beta fold hydrolase [Vagococcus intermedius]|uniref:Alpha/beta fold hydrolase n=1 Tax=Vagococcus intermedius TaxID=2991418 RepID=A0AAF0CTE0_9ENTE|nr:alpha/beta fold hydrolase [Vagococcus intermedius]WEG72605.1 alpha/beta fold hydrolase [Vagococcus intermedius]WEG74690.1 alpha/beta fold hydrolase [Vagococcus intermedius]
MKIQIRERMIHDIPVLEVVSTEKMNEALPLVIFYHGWQTNKELLLTQARRLADKGLRAVLPDGMHHGQRKIGEKSSVPSVTFYSTIQYNLIEFNVIKKYFEERQLIKNDLIGVGGYSMGGMTSAALVTQHPEITAIASIMGTPQPTNYASLIRKNAKKMNYNVPDDLALIHSWLPQFDLSLQPEKMAQRPILFWHGTEDPKIPFNQVADFYHKIEHEPYAKNVIFLTGQGEGHLVTIDLMNTIADFFEQHLK